MVFVRWLLVLPGGGAAGYLAWLLVTVANRLTMAMYVDPDSFMSRVFIETVANGSMGAATVYAGARIAPTKQSKVALGLSILVTLAGGFLLFQTLQAKAWWPAYGIACAVAGALSIAVSIYQGEEVGLLG